MSKSGFAPGADLSCAEDPYWATATAAAKHKTNKSQNARRMVPPCLELGPYSPDGIEWILCSVGTECKGCTGAAWQVTAGAKFHSSDPRPSTHKPNRTPYLVSFAGKRIHRAGR